jgi:hypothetical protein
VEFEEEEFRVAAWRAATDSDDAALRARGAASLAILGATATRREPSDPWRVRLSDADLTAFVAVLTGATSTAGAESGARTDPFVPKPPPELARKGGRWLLLRLPVAGPEVVRTLVAQIEERDDWVAPYVLSSLDPEALRKGVGTGATVTAAQADALLRIGDAAPVRKTMTSGAPELRVPAAVALAEGGVLDADVFDVLLEAVKSRGNHGVPTSRLLDLIGSFGPDRVPTAAARLKALAPRPEYADDLALAIARTSVSEMDLANTWRAWRAKPASDPREMPSDWPDAFARAVEASNDPARLAAFVAVLDPATDEPRLLAAACAAIGRLGPKANDLIGPLTKWLASVERWRKASPTKAEVPTLQDFLTLGKHADLSHHLRAPALEALGRIGPAARDAVPALESLLSSGDERIRHLAARALRRIRAK